MIDERGLDAACREFKEHLYIAGKTSKDERIALQAAIEAYEKVKWRPIEEAPRISWPNECGDWLLVSWPNSEWPPQTLRRGPNRGVWLTTDTGVWYESSLIKSGAMFRTIDLPTQDAVSAGMEGASDDESNKPFISVHDELSEPGDRRMDQETPRSKS